MSIFDDIGSDLQSAGQDVEGAVDTAAHTVGSDVSQAATDVGNVVSSAAANPTVQEAAEGVVAVAAGAV